MKTIRLNRDWSSKEKAVSLPFDALSATRRNYSAAHGGLNSFYDAASVRIERTMPVRSYYKAFLETSGVGDKANIYGDGKYLGTATYPGRNLLPLSSGISKIAYDIAAVNSGRYTGCGISDGVTLYYASSPLYIDPYGVTVYVTPALKAELAVEVALTNETGARRKATLTVEVFNRRGRRLTKKNKTVQVPAGRKVCYVKAAFSRYSFWPGPESVYTMRVSLQSEEMTDEAETVFGIQHEDGLPEMQRLASDNGILGAASFLTSEKRKLSILKRDGYTAAITGLPSDALLQAADEKGIRLIVQPFEFLYKPPTPFVPPVTDADVERLLDNIRAIRNHPCVVAYAMPDDEPDKTFGQRIATYGLKPVVRLNGDAYYFDFLGREQTDKRRYNAFGRYDVLGIEKPGASARSDAPRIVVTPPGQAPISAWDFPDCIGQEVTVEVHTAGEVVSLLLDGKQIGRKLAGSVNGYKATFNVEYRPGVLEAVCFHRGFEQARVRLGETSAPKRLRLTPQTKFADSSGDGLAYFLLEVTDTYGNAIVQCDSNVSVQVTGGELFAFDSGDPYGEKETDDTVKLYGGKALVVIRATEPGRTYVKATSEGLRTARKSVRNK